MRTHCLLILVSFALVSCGCTSRETVDNEIPLSTQAQFEFEVVEGAEFSTKEILLRVGDRPLPTWARECLLAGKSIWLRCYHESESENPALLFANELENVTDAHGGYRASHSGENKSGQCWSWVGLIAGRKNGLGNAMASGKDRLHLIGTSSSSDTYVVHVRHDHYETMLLSDTPGALLVVKISGCPRGKECLIVFEHWISIDGGELFRTETFTTFDDCLITVGSVE